MNKYRLFKMNSRGGRYYAEDIVTRERKSLRTPDSSEADKLLHAMNEASRNSQLNQMMGQAYLSASDPLAMTRSWRDVVTTIIASKTGDTHYRWTIAGKDKAFKLILDVPLLRTTANQVLDVLTKGTVSTNVFLRRIQNFAVDVGWLPKPILPKKQNPKLAVGQKHRLFHRFSPQTLTFIYGQFPVSFVFIGVLIKTAFV